MKGQSSWKILSLVIFSMCLVPERHVLQEDHSAVGYLVRISWNDRSHGQMKYWWFLSLSTSNYSDPVVTLGERSYQLSPVKFPDYECDIAVCCSVGDLNKINAYLKERIGDECEAKRKVDLKASRSFKLKTVTAGVKVEFRFFKVSIDYCMCRAPSYQPASSYSDSVILINNVNATMLLSRGEKIAFNKHFDSLLTSKAIVETLPVWGAPNSSDAYMK